MQHINRMFVTVMIICIWLLAGSCIDTWLFGEPDFMHIMTWGVMVFWPLVLLWYFILWVIVIGAAGIGVFIAYIFISDRLEKRRLYRSFRG